MSQKKRLENGRWEFSDRPKVKPKDEAFLNNWAKTKKAPDSVERAEAR